MDLRDAPEHEALRAEVRAFLRESWPPRGEAARGTPAEQEIRFRRRGIERGYVYRAFPKRYGGSERQPDVLVEAILQQEYAAAGAPREAYGGGPAMLAPTLLAHGSEAQKRALLPPTLSGELRWCQGYSEPGAGSDLASLRSRAVRDGDAWVIDGHKIWTSSAHVADWMFGLFRTEPDAERHAGLSYLLVPMRQPGIEVRPLRQMNGDADFNEVFLRGARTPVSNTLGKPGEGWRISRTTLRHERDMLSNPRRLREAFDDLLALARRTPRGGGTALDDPHLRQRLAEIEGLVLAQECSGWRQLTAAARGDEADTRLAVLMNKLYTTEIRGRLSSLGWELLGGEGLLAPEPADLAPWGARETPGGWTNWFMLTLATAIAGGSTNIQRNVIGERGLGLPRDLRRA